jgi:hypothetical protein
MKKIVALGLGALLIVLALVYGFSGLLVPSIPSRSANITRWENELVKERQNVEVALAEADKLGKEPASTAAESSPFERKLAHIDQMNQNLRATVDRIDYERGRRKEMSIITGVLGSIGILGMALGIWLRR